MHMNQVIITDDTIGIVVNISFSRKNNVESNSFLMLMIIVIMIVIVVLGIAIPSKE